MLSHAIVACCLLERGVAEPEEKDARILGDATLSALQAFVGEEYATMVLHCCRPPEVFAGLLLPDIRDRTVILRYLKELWEALEQVEGAYEPGHWLRKWLDEQLWPTSGLVRELLISLHEANFESIPSDSLRIVQAMFENQGSSRVMELAFKHATAQMRLSSSSQSSRLSRWRWLVSSTLLAENGMEEVRPHATESAEQEVLNDATFVASHGDCSLAGQAVDTMAQAGFVLKTMGMIAGSFWDSGWQKNKFPSGNFVDTSFESTLCLPISLGGGGGWGPRGRIWGVLGCRNGLSISCGSS